jgi:serine/threonine-protein kinase
LDKFPREKSEMSSSPRRFGRYQLVAELGPSELGTLWLGIAAEGSEQGRLVNMRRFPLTQAEAAAALERAGAVAARIRDAALVAVLEVVKSDAELLIVSEYVDGEALGTLMRRAVSTRTPLAPAVAVRIAADVVKSLRAARNLWTRSVPVEGADQAQLLSYVYGGLSPATVFITSYGDTLVSDVGVSGAAALLAPFVELPEFTAYRAPEQLEPSPSVDERADVFSVGVLLWEMLANRSLFGAPGLLSGNPNAAKEVSQRIASAPVSRLDSIERSGLPIPRSVVNLVQKALERDEAERYQTLEDLSHAISVLPAECTASPEQVAMTLDRLLRESVEARRSAVALSAGSSGRDTGPPASSNRPTLRPQKPPSVSVQAAPGKAGTPFRGLRQTTLGFAPPPKPVSAPRKAAPAASSPSAGRPVPAPRPPPVAPPATAALPPAPKLPEPPTPAPAPEPVPPPAEVRAPAEPRPAAAEVPPTSVSPAPAAPAAAVAADVVATKGSKRLVVGLAVALACVGAIAVAAMTMRPSRSAGERDPVKAVGGPAVREKPAAPMAAAPPPASAVTETAAAADAAAQAPELSDAAADQAGAAASAKPSGPAAPAQRPARPRKQRFKPQGI